MSQFPKTWIGYCNIFHFYVLFHYAIVPLPSPQGKVNARILNVSKQDNTERTNKMYLNIVKFLWLQINIQFWEQKFKDKK